MSLTAALRWQAAACAALGSAFTSRLCQVLADRLAPGTPFTDRLFGWPGDLGPAGASLPLRLTGGLHALVLTGRDPGLAALYPPAPPPDHDTLSATVATALDAHAAFLDLWVDTPPQTNETGRGAVLLAAAHWLAARFARPLFLSEVGASAGLNLNFDRFRVEAAGRPLGPADASLILRPCWTGRPPDRGRLRIVPGRQGCDIAPLDPRDGDAALPLAAFICPDPRGRLAGLHAAMALPPAPVIGAGAVDWLGPRLARAPRGAVHMIYSTVAWQYLPPADRARGAARIATAGRRATSQTPLAWFRMEADGGGPGAGLSLILWPPGRQIAMGRADFHGRWVDWRAPRPI